MKTYLQIVDGYPVPYSLTVYSHMQVADAGKYRMQIEKWLAENRPGSVIDRIEGAYVFYKEEGREG